MTFFLIKTIKKSGFLAKSYDYCNNLLFTLPDAIFEAIIPNKEMVRNTNTMFMTLNFTG